MSDRKNSHTRKPHTVPMKSDPNDTESGLDEQSKEFNEYLNSLDEIQQLQQDKIVPSKPKKLISRSIAQQHSNDIKHDSFDHYSDQDDLSDEFDPFENDIERYDLNYYQPCFGQKHFKKLQKGSFYEQAHLDLHGMSKADARKCVSQFLDDCYHKQYKKVLIIPGYGHGILRAALNIWLRQLSIVLAFAESPQRYGGRGVIRLQLTSAKD